MEDDGPSSTSLPLYSTSIEDLNNGYLQFSNCQIKLRENPVRRKERVFIGCGAGFGGDRPLAAVRLLQRVKELDYLVLECLAERTLADRYQEMQSGGKGYDPRLSEWMKLLLPLAIDKGVCIITNMGAKSPFNAREELIRIACDLGISITVGVACQFPLARSDGDTCVKDSHLSHRMKYYEDSSVYLGASPIVECLEKYRPNIVITSRVADAALFLGPMVYELGWNWDQLELLAQGSLAGHLLECGCQLTGGYFMHPGDRHRDMSVNVLLDLSLPYAEIGFDGTVCVAKPENTGGVINLSTCTQQLLYEVGDPSAYITPDIIIDFRDVTFESLSEDKVLCSGAKPSAESVPDRLLCLVSKDRGWKGWGEISYGGRQCVERAKAAEFLVRSWIEQMYPGINNHMISYIIGLDSVKARSIDDEPQASEDIRLRMDGLFEREEHAVQFVKEFTALYTNGPAGGGGISTGLKKEIILEKELVEREDVRWCISGTRFKIKDSIHKNSVIDDIMQIYARQESMWNSVSATSMSSSCREPLCLLPQHSPAPSGQKIALYDVAHSRAGDKGNDVNFSIIPHFPPDFKRLKLVLTPEWVIQVVSPLLNTSSFPGSEDTKTRDAWVKKHVKVEIYELRGTPALNIVVRNILDGGVNCSRRIDRHGKTISDLILCQQVVLPP